MRWIYKFGIVAALFCWLAGEGWVVSPSSIGLVKTEELSRWLQKGERLQVLDTRTATFDDFKRLPGAMSLPYNTPEKVIRQKLPSLDAKVVVYCGHAKCPASQYMAERLVRLGYKQVYRYAEGIKTWSQEGKPVEIKMEIKMETKKEAYPKSAITPKPV